MLQGTNTAQVKAAVQWYRTRRRLIQNWAQFLVPGALFLALVSARIAGMGWVEGIQHKVFDAFQRARPRPYEPVAVRVIDIDDESLARLGQWPWPRTQVGRLVRRLADLGAAVTAFDAVFAEPDRTSPARVAGLWPRTPETAALRQGAARLPDHDQVLAGVLGRTPVVLGFALVAEPNEVQPAAKALFAYGGDGPLAFLDDYPGAVANLPVLEGAAAGNGCFNFVPERDGMARRAPMLFARGQTLLPALSAEALRVAQGATNISVKTAGASGERSYGRQHTGISKLKIGRYVVPTDAKGSVWVYFTQDPALRTIPAWKVFEKGFDRSQVEGGILYVGTSAAGLKDLRATPLDPALAGVQVHANVTEQILLGRFLQRPDWAAGAELIYMVLLGLLLLALLPWLGAAWCAWLAGAGVAAAVGFSWRMFSSRGLLVDPVFPCLTVLVVYMSSSLISYLKSETERRQVRGAFSRYMHPKLVEELAKHPEKLRLGGETRDMTILFCDIRGFTTISEQFDAAGLTAMINKFLTPMTGIIMDRLGYIDKYIGDCIMAFWNAPLDDAEHARNACRSALAMHARLAELDVVWKEEALAAGRKYVPIHIGVGLNTGPCCVGNMGSDQRFNYSVLGDDVNLASRLEGQSKPYGVSTVIGPRTRELTPEFAALELDLIRVKGKTRPVRIFTLLGDEPKAQEADFKRHAETHGRMLAAYRGQKWEEALALLAGCRRAPLPLEKLYDLYETRIAAFQLHPPASNWDGTFTATTK
ncbi:MAG: adenylate/guanylate cyclase domain-containing protein [Elusimicrobia bacterium]|nr:adenylate/guanylate cyclase domain-containing protein [Elusimicrobiota bacterium]